MNKWTSELFSPIDEITAEVIGKSVNEEVSLLIKYVSAAFRLGHLFVSISDREINPDPTYLIGSESIVSQDDLESFRNLLQEGFSWFANHSLPQLVKQENRLFLKRAWELSQDIDFHFKRLQHTQARFSVDKTRAETLVQRYLKDGALHEDQALAILHAIKNPVFSIWGGPGTGKTHTAGLFLKVLLQSLPDEDRAKWKIAIAAPTGKATNNLTKSIQRAFGSENVQIDSKTLHALLQIRSPGQRKEQEESLFLPYDMMIVDESSMIDASLCAKLLSRLADGSRLLFLGDPAQLPPVEPGSPFCAFVEAQRPSLGKLIASRRTEITTILELAALVNEGKEEEVIAFLNGCRETKEAISFHHLEERSFASYVAGYVKGLPSEGSAEKRFVQLNKKQMLSPLKKGLFGTKEINDQVYRQVLFQKKDSFEPLVITKNDYQLGLSNGQIGLASGEDTVLFESGDKEPRIIPRVLLSLHEQAYCLSVHKSQGSEFDHVVLLLPPGSETFGRKMLYTAITRARKSLEIWGSEEVIRAVVRRS